MVPRGRYEIRLMVLCLQIMPARCAKENGTGKTPLNLFIVAKRQVERLQDILTPSKLSSVRHPQCMDYNDVYNHPNLPLEPPRLIRQDASPAPKSNIQPSSIMYYFHYCPSEDGMCLGVAGRE